MKPRARAIDREAFHRERCSRTSSAGSIATSRVGLDAIIPAWHERMAPGLAARATIDGAALVGEVAGLDRDGALLLRDDGGRVHRVRTGDVEVVRPTP